MQFLSEKLSRHLSSLVPGFDGHWAWYSGYIFHHDTGEKELVGEPFLVCVKEKFDRHMGTRICPAWQAEDLLRNITEIQLMGHKRTESSFIMRTVVEKIVDCLAFSTPDTAYQKIEEYLWTVLR